MTGLAGVPLDFAMGGGAGAMAGGGGPAVFGTGEEEADTEEVMMQGGGTQPNTSSGMDVDNGGRGGGGSGGSALPLPSNGNYNGGGSADSDHLPSVDMIASAVDMIASAGMALGPPLIKSEDNLTATFAAPITAAAPGPAVSAIAAAAAAAGLAAAAPAAPPFFLEKDVYYSPGDRAPKAKKTYMASLGMTEIESAKEMRTIRHQESVRNQNMPLGGRRGRPRGSRAGGRGRGRGYGGYGGYGRGGRSRNNIVIGDDDDHDDQCFECAKPGELLMCDTCTRVWHTTCLNPPLTIVPDGDWSCPVCLTPPAAPLDEDAANGKPRVNFSFLQVEQQWFDYVMQVQHDADLLKAGSLRLRAQKNSLTFRKQVVETESATVQTDIAAKRQRLADNKAALSALQQQIHQIRFGATIQPAAAGTSSNNAGAGAGAGGAQASAAMNNLNLAKAAAAAAAPSFADNEIETFGEVPPALPLRAPPAAAFIPGPPPPGAY